MKQFFLVKKTLFLLLFVSLGAQAVQDQPALTGKQRAARIIMRGAAASIGALVGVPLLFLAFDYNPYNGYRDDRKVAGGALISLVGSAALYTAMDALATKFFAHQNTVSYHVQKIALLYDINVDQYRTVLELAQAKKSGALRSELSQILEQHCGAQWQDKLSEFLTQYRDFAAYLVGLKKSLLNERELQMLRVIEIGAALENIYFGSKSSKEQMVSQAVKLYQQIGLYDPFKKNEQ